MTNVLMELEGLFDDKPTPAKIEEVVVSPVDLEEVALRVLVMVAEKYKTNPVETKKWLSQLKIIGE